MNVPNDIHLNLHSQELGGKVIFFFPLIHFFLSSPMIFFTPLSTSKKSLEFLQSQQTIFLQVLSLTILEACLAIL